MITEGSAMFTVSLNDRLRTVVAGATLQDLLRDLAIAERRGLAVAINDEVVPRASWPTRPLADLDRILVIQATQGG